MKSIMDELLSWFFQVREEYYFRKHRNPYRVWIAEVVLQQTRIQAALEPLQRFFHIFPDVESLSNATEQEVLQAFKGLGYYSRARNLKKGAEYICQHFQGQLPQTSQELLKIPSIGPYTAAAIASICFQEIIPVVDGNIKRILARIHRWNECQDTMNFAKKCTKFLLPLYKKSQHTPGDMNEAWMELGQKICLLRPKCSLCPISSFCQGFQHNDVEKYPVKKQKKEKIHVDWHVFIIRNKANILLQKWGNFYFLQNQTSLPSTLIFEDKTISSFQNLPIPSISEKKYSNPIKHAITHHNIHIYSHIIDNLSIPDKILQQENCFWTPQQNAPNHLVASALLKIFAKQK
ncbi:MAG: A/G-specific adenine glycosylase [Planctomycetes bacterium]|jgi:A/G-specific adenine glycosylase|nr:A/G-specific adenine glycosylase [Planctomycetota bacterium]